METDKGQGRNLVPTIALCDELLDLLDKGALENVNKVVKRYLGINVKFRFCPTIWKYEALFEEVGDATLRQLNATPLLRCIFSRARLCCILYFDNDNSVEGLVSVAFDRDFNSDSNVYTLMKFKLDTEGDVTSVVTQADCHGGQN